MNLENQKIQNLELVDPSNGSAGFFGESSRRIATIPFATDVPKFRKPRGFCMPVAVISGIALCVGLVSCVVPYDSYGNSSVSVSRYNPGYRVNSLPGGYRSETISGSTYYYHDGNYYRPSSRGYVIVDAPRSSRYYDDYRQRQRNYQISEGNRSSYGRSPEYINRLPDGYREVNRRGTTYYQVGDRQYRRDNNGYVIVDRPY